jgi:hypothetical protein
MSLPELIARFVRPLAQLEVPYMVMAGVAAIIYSEPRYTQDLDLLLKLDADRAADFAAAFPPDEFYVPPVEAIEAKSRRAAFGHFNLAHHDTGFRADIYLAGADPVHAWGLAHRRRVMLREEPLWLAPVEYVIVGKLKFYREGGSSRHLEDIAAILRVSSDRIDVGELNDKIAEEGLAAEWGRVLKT